MAYSAKVIMKCLNVLRVNPFPFSSSSYIMCARESFEKRKVFVV